MKIRVQGTDIDLNGHLPLTVKDWRALKGLGVGLNTLRLISEPDFDTDERLEKMVKIAEYILKKAGASFNSDAFTQDDITTVMNAITRSERREDIDRPT